MSPPRRGYAARARQLAPTDKTARDLFDQVRSERRPVVSVSVDGANDIEHNSFVLLTGAFSASPRPDLRGTLQATWRQNDDAVTTDQSTGLDGWLVKSFRSGRRCAGGWGCALLNPTSGPTHSNLTAQAGRYGPARQARRR